MKTDMKTDSQSCSEDIKQGWMLLLIGLRAGVTFTLQCYNTLTVTMQQAIYVPKGLKANQRLDKKNRITSSNASRPMQTRTMH